MFWTHPFCCVVHVVARTEGGRCVLGSHQQVQSLFGWVRGCCYPLPMLLALCNNCSISLILVLFTSPFLWKRMVLLFFHCLGIFFARLQISNIRARMFPSGSRYLSKP